MTPEFQAEWQREIDKFMWAEKNTPNPEFQRLVTEGKCWWFYNRRLNVFMMMPEKKVPKKYIPGLSRIKHLKWYFLGTTVQGVIDEIKPGEKALDTGGLTMDNEKFIENAKILAALEYDRQLETFGGKDAKPMNIHEVFVVWLCKTLQNNKALLSTTRSGDGSYIEVTYNGSKKEYYVDVYKKLHNQKYSEQMLKGSNGESLTIPVAKD